jgi:uncharacterized protein
MHAEARVATPKSALYLTRLCRHFSHKVPAEYDSDSALVRFPFGLCEMHIAPDHLVLLVQADDAAAFERVKEVVGGHLEQCGRREGIQVQWLDRSPVATGDSG